VNPPVAYMLHAGAPRLLAAGVHLPALHDGNAADKNAAGHPRRVALEAYPGLLARSILSNRSYKSDDKAKQTSDRLIARKDVITALENGQTRLATTHGPLRLKLTHAQRDTLVGDASGDSLDAVLCMLQAAWAKAQHDAGHARYGLPKKVDALEGWIITS
jgi:predicted RNase H-like nuclease